MTHRSLAGVDRWGHKHEHGQLQDGPHSSAIPCDSDFSDMGLDLLLASWLVVTSIMQ